MQKDRGPNVRVPPPTFFVAGFLVGLLFDSTLKPIRLVGESESPRTLAMFGVAIAIIGCLVAASGMVTFWRARTAIVPVHPASRLVQHGLYRFTRNPMYVGLTLAYVGIALAMNTGWPLVILPVVLFAVSALVIRREERYLAQAFGEAYDAYRRRVRRWI